MPHASTSASGACDGPSFPTIERAILDAEPESLISRPKIAPSRNSGKYFATNPPRLVM